jgi:hypothetical protein
MQHSLLRLLDLFVHSYNGSKQETQGPEAVALLEQVVKVREQTLAQDHPSRLTSQHSLTMAYRATHAWARDYQEISERTIRG